MGSTQSTSTWLTFEAAAAVGTPECIREKVDIIYVRVTKDEIYDWQTLLKAHSKITFNFPPLAVPSAKIRKAAAEEFLRINRKTGWHNSFPGAGSEA